MASSASEKNSLDNETFFNDDSGLVFDQEPDGQFEPDTDFSLDDEVATAESASAWKVLVVDDEKDIHTVVRLALHDFNFQGRGLAFYDAYSAQEAKAILVKEEDIAVVLLDVVMESMHAGLDLVRFVRNQIKNPFSRIVLWTGQPGQAPEKEVIERYEINDYRTKTELTSDKLFTVVLASLRNYEAIRTVEGYRKNLEEKVEQRTEELTQQTVELQAQRNELEKVNATKDKFFRIISHDLKNPFAAMLSVTDSLLTSFEDLDRDDLLYGLQKVKGSTSKLYDLLEKLLQWSKAQTNTISYEPERLDIKTVVSSEIALAQLPADKKKITIKDELQAGLCSFADRNMLQTVVRNLLSNAIKFSFPQSTIVVKSEEENYFWRLKVSDQGTGMSQDDVDKLFKVDKYFSKKGTAKEEGTGLGLLICMEFIIRNGGEMHVESVEGKGSCFSFTLPKTDVFCK